MIDSTKFFKLLKRLEKMSTDLYVYKDFRLHRYINHSYYLQRVEETKILLEQLVEAEKMVENVHLRLQEHYCNSFNQWHADVRKLASYLQYTDAIRPMYSIEMRHSALNGK